MTRPALGLCIPVTYLRCIDGDTVEVSILGGDTYSHIRLLDCWCDDKAPKEDRERAKRYAETLMERCLQPVLFVPLDNGKPAMNLINSLTSMGRMLGHIWLSQTTTLSKCMVAAGYATKQKPPRE